MDSASDRSPAFSALLIAGTYAVVSVLWILFSDAIVATLATSRAQLTAFQSVKGIVFVILSATLVYGLVYATFRQLAVRNQRLEAALRQAGLLHRIARHNIRNSCNAIGGHLEFLAERWEPEDADRFDAIRSHNERLLTLSRKSQYLRLFLDPTTVRAEAIDLVPVVETRVETARERYPDAVIETDLPAEAWVSVHSHVGDAVDELVENAIVHNSAAEPYVDVTLASTDESVALTVADDGPGLPALEQRVIQQAEETPTEHSQGLGLWLVRLTAEFSEGAVEVADSDRGGTAVTLTLPTVSDAETGLWGQATAFLGSS